ncbi:MAG: hypothetical protein KF797_10300 [Flavobacteriales bacterium]|nr:hypothetical protein [Flavobacteriales bacterium]
MPTTNRPLWLLLAVFLLPLVSSAQADKIKVRVKISDDREADARLRPYSIIRSSPNAVMMFRNGEFDIRAFGSLKSRLDLYDRNKLTFIRSQQPAEKLGNGAKLHLEDVVYFAGKPLLIARNEDGPATIHYQVLDPNLTRLPAPHEQLCSWPVEVKTKHPLVATAGSSIRAPFLVEVSRDSSHMLIRSPEIRTDDKQAIYLLAMIGKDMQVEWQHTVPVSDNARHSEIIDAEVDEQGNAYLVVRNKFGRKEVDDGEVNFEIKLFKVSAQGAEESVVRLGSDVFPSSGILRSLADDKLAFAGVYASAADKKLRTQGNFLITFEAGATALPEPLLLPFNAQTDLNAEGEPEEDPKDKHVNKDNKRMAIGTDLIGLLPRAGGGYFLVNELFYVSTYYDMNAKRYVTMYTHGPVQARSIGAGGKEEWSSTFRRWTRSESILLGRVFPAEYNDQLFLFLLDSEEMAERRKKGEKIKPGHIKGPYSAYVSFDDKGEFRIKAVLRSEKDEDFISGWELIRTGADEYFALGTEKLVSGRFLPVRIDFANDRK